MSLGGYKFAGYKCKKPSDSSLNDDELSLLIHNTRLKAFTEACRKSGANWHFCKNSGALDFEENIGVTYKIVNVLCDFISYFQYRDEDKYFCIITCPEITDSIFSDKSRGRACYSSSSNQYIWQYRTMFHCASIAPLPDDFFITSVQQSYPAGALPLIPISTIYKTTSSSVCTRSDNGKWFSYIKDGLSTYFGYAIKDSKIITFSAQDNADNNYISTGQFFVNVIGFDAMKLSSSSDHYNLFHASLNKATTHSNECYIPSQKNAEYTINNCVQVLNSVGEVYAESGCQSSCYINTATPAAYIYGVSNNIPYSHVYITTHENEGQSTSIRTSGTLLNSDGIYCKGMVDIDLIASNVTTGYSSLKSCGAYANGNYLLGCKDYGGNVQYYVGWDKSNPDITLSSSWISYTNI